jgi:ribonuclease Z
VIEIGLVEIYGPEGIRNLVRATIQLTYSRVVAPFCVHELKSIPFLHENFRNYAPELPIVYTSLYPQYNEREGGRDIYPDENGVYHVLENTDFVVKAAPLQHSIPCVGFVVEEKTKACNLKPEVVRPLMLKNRDGLLQRYPQLNNNINKMFSIFKQMNTNESFEFPDGTVLNSSEFFDLPKKGIRMLFCTAHLFFTQSFFFNN